MKISFVPLLTYTTLTFYLFFSVIQVIFLFILIMDTTSWIVLDKKPNHCTYIKQQGCNASYHNNGSRFIYSFSCTLHNLYGVQTRLNLAVTTTPTAFSIDLLIMQGNVKYFSIPRQKNISIFLCSAIITCCVLEVWILSHVALDRICQWSPE